MKKRSWREISVITFVVLLGLGTFAGLLAYSQQRGVEARAAAIGWQQNSDGLVYVRVVAENDLGKVPRMPIHLLTSALSRSEPVVGIQIRNLTFLMHFPPALQAVDGKRIFTTDMILDFSKAVENFPILVRRSGMISDGGRRTILIRHKAGAEFSAVEEDGQIFHVVDVVKLLD